MSNSLERYQKLGIKDSLPRIYQYPIACKELSFILRGAYNKLPKNLQSMIFQDTLSAFRLLPEMQTHSAVSAANLLLQSAEAALPKQKRNSAVAEFKHAKVAHKRRCKARQKEKGSAQLPQDILVHIFSFLDMQSLASVGQVCWSWNLAASDNYLWQSQYATFFHNFGNYSKSGKLVEDEVCTPLQGDVVSRTTIDWREAFKSAFIGNSSKRLTSNRGYCGRCNAIVWLNNMKCFNGHLESENHQIKPVTPSQVVEYLLDNCLSLLSSSDSDSDSDSEGLISRLWAYPRHISRSQKKPF